MVIVDTHCHASLDWYEPVETLVYQMDANGKSQPARDQIFGQTGLSVFPIDRA